MKAIFDHSMHIYRFHVKFILFKIFSLVFGTNCTKRAILEEESAVFIMSPTSIMDASSVARKVVSDISGQIDNVVKDFQEIVRVEEQVTKAKCDCCGLSEEYTPNYIKKIKESHSGNWVCGLCSEAVGEMIRRGAPYVEMQEALEKHREFFQEFNGTTRANPKLAYTSTMRKIARRSSEYKRESKGISKISRSSSCIPRMNNN